MALLSTSCLQSNAPTCTTTGPGLYHSPLAHCKGLLDVIFGKYAQLNDEGKGMSVLYRSAVQVHRVMPLTRGQIHTAHISDSMCEPLCSKQGVCLLQRSCKKRCNSEKNEFD